MLGWEFPPVINGGLGVACHDLAIAMGSHADITMIIPKASPEYKLNCLNLIGLNNIDPKYFENTFVSSFPEEKLSYVHSDINPYYTDSVKERKESYSQRFSESAFDRFNIDSLYGGNVVNKVQQFAKITTKLALEKDFDIIHAHDWMTMLAGVAIKEKTGKPLVVHVHSLEVDRGGESSKGWVYETERSCMNKADLLIPVSNFTGQIIKKYYGIDESKISPVHNGIRKVKPFKRKKSFREKTVLFVGRLTRQKGPEYFLEIADKILSAYPDVRFVMAGAGDNYQRMIENSAYKKIGHRFHFTGFLNTSQLNELLSISDAYVMPSVSEPFGLSAVEAAQFGVPCVISRQSGVAEVLTGSLKFDFWDTSKASDYIINLLSNKTLSEKVKEDAFVSLENISWEIAANKVMEAYRNFNFLPN